MGPTFVQLLLESTLIKRYPGEEAFRQLTFPGHGPPLRKVREENFGGQEPGISNQHRGHEGVLLAVYTHLAWSDSPQPRFF